MDLTRKVVVVALALGTTSPAWATAGNGIRFGGSEGRLHPFLELEGRYDSNVFVSTAGVATAGESSGDFILHVRPGLRLNIPGDLTQVEASAKLDFAQYLGTETSESKDLSKVYAEADLGITVNKNGTVGLEIDDLFRRGDRPQVLALGTAVVSNFNALTVRVPWRPGGGALTFGLTGAWELETFEKLFSGDLCDATANPLCSSTTLGRLSYNALSATADLRWRFLPRTSAILEGEFFKRVPFNSQIIANVPNDPAGLRVQAGITGLVTPHVAATLEAGYGATVSTTPSLSTWLATAELEWLPTEASQVKLTYSHDLGVEPWAFFDVNRLTLSARQVLAGRLALAVRASYSHLGYQGSSDATTVLHAEPSIGYEVTRWARAELAYAYTDRASDATATARLNAPDYTKNEIWLKATFTY